MTRIGIIGFGFMGRTHLEAYAEDGRAEIAAIAEADPDRVGEASRSGNIVTGRGTGRDAVSLEGARIYPNAQDLFDDDGVDAVSICVPTPQHVELAEAALAAGKHVLLEKPIALDEAGGRRVVEAAGRHPALVAMPAMCMRFWPGWGWLRETIASGRYGPVRSATFTRLGSMPDWGRSFYGDPSQSGGALLDLHIHDADFVRHCFGDPVSVAATGATGPSGGIDHVSATYRFESGPTLVRAEGAWMAAPKFPFSMRYRVDFESATADLDSAREQPLLVHTAASEPEVIALPPGNGYRYEIAHFLEAIEAGRAPELVSIVDGLEAVRLIEAERASIERGEPVAFRPSH